MIFCVRDSKEDWTRLDQKIAELNLLQREDTKRKSLGTEFPFVREPKLIWSIRNFLLDLSPIFYLSIEMTLPVSMNLRSPFHSRLSPNRVTQNRKPCASPGTPDFHSQLLSPVTRILFLHPRQSLPRKRIHSIAPTKPITWTSQTKCSFEVLAVLLST